MLNVTLATIAAVQSREYTYGVECGVKLAAHVISGEIQTQMPEPPARARVTILHREFDSDAGAVLARVRVLNLTFNTSH